MNATGFTLYELLITLAITSILSAMAAPSFSGIIARQSLRSTATDIQVALLQSRAEAAKRGVAVTLRPAESGWMDGWEIVDANDEDVARVQRDRKVAITANVPEVVYLPSGRVRGNVRVTFNLVSEKDEDLVKCVSTAAGGKPLVKAQTC